MSEPGLLAQSQSQAAPGESLWERAPGWRRLTVTASLLTMVAVAVPVLVPQATVPQAAIAVPHAAAPPQVAFAAPPPAAVPQAATPQAAAPSAAQPVSSCAIVLPPQGEPRGAGIVTGFEDPQVSQPRVRANERINGGPINPLYASTPRALVRMDGNSGMQAVPLPPGMIVHPGDHVVLNGPHRDGTACAYIPLLVTADDGPLTPNAPQQQLAMAGPAAQTANPAQALPADLPVGTVIVAPGVESRVNVHSRWAGTTNFPITITMVTPPAHGTVTTRQAMGPRPDANGVTKIVPITQVFYQSAPGYSGVDSFTYRRTSTDPTDPVNGTEITVNVDVGSQAAVDQGPAAKQ